MGHYLLLGRWTRYIQLCRYGFDSWRFSIPVGGLLQRSGNRKWRHNGSKNFCVHYGYTDNSGYASENLPYIYFGDGVARVVDHMYVTMTTYLANCVANGNGLTAPAGEDDWVKLVAIGYDEDGNEVDASEAAENGDTVYDEDGTRLIRARLQQKQLQKTVEAVM